MLPVLLYTVSGELDLDVLDVTDYVAAQHSPSDDLVSFEFDVNVVEAYTRGKEQSHGDHPFLELEVSYFIPDANITAPTVTNSAATNVTMSAARLNGQVTDTGGEAPSVTIYWGDNDGVTTPGSYSIEV